MYVCTVLKASKAILKFYDVCILLGFSQHFGQSLSSAVNLHLFTHATWTTINIMVHDVSHIKSLELS